MRLITTDIELSNPKNSALKPLLVQAMVDTGVMTICIPEHVAVQLDLQEIEKREVTTADGSHVVPYVGPIRIRFQNRTCFTGALVSGESVLLGTVPLEDMDLVVSPSRQTTTVNPESPNLPSAVVKQRNGITHWMKSTHSIADRTNRRYKQVDAPAGIQPLKRDARRDGAIEA